MDCRKPLYLLLGLLVAAGGCSSTLPALRDSPKPKVDEDEVRKPDTYVKFGNYRAQSANAPERTGEQRQELREDARLSYQKALEVDPKCLPAYVGLAKLQQAVEDHAGAAKVYAKAIDLFPDESALWFEMGMCQCRAKDFTAALGSMSKALELAPTNRHIATTTGYALARAGQWDEAYKVLARVSGQAKAHYDIARMLRHVNEPAKAREHAVAALGADASFDAARALLAEMDAPKTTPAVAPTQSQLQPQQQPLRLQPMPMLTAPSGMSITVTPQESPATAPRQG